MIVAQAIEVLRDLCAERDEGEELRTEYSGRGMMGATCLGVTTEHPAEFIEEAAAAGVRGAKMDQMGRRFIVYWPDLKTTAATPAT